MHDLNMTHLTHPTTTDRRVNDTKLTETYNKGATVRRIISVLVTIGLILGTMAVPASAATSISAAKSCSSRSSDVYRPGGIFVLTGTGSYKSGYWWSEIQQTNGCGLIQFELGFVVNRMNNSPWPADQVGCSSGRVRFYPTNRPAFDGAWKTLCHLQRVTMATDVLSGTKYRIRWQETTYPFGTSRDVAVGDTFD